MNDADVVRRRTVTAVQLRHASIAIDLHERLTIVGGADRGRVNDLLSAIRDGQATWAFGSDRAAVDYRPPVLAAHRPVDDPTPAATDAELQSAVAAAEAALSDARAAVEAAEAAYTAAQDELLVLRRDADRDAARALAQAEERLREAQETAANARRAQRAMREEAAAAADGDLGAVKELEERRERLRAAREETAARLLQLPPAIDARPVVEALEGLRRLRTVKPRPMARAVEIADRLGQIAESLAEMPVESPPEWLVTPALDALRSAKAELEALESGKPMVAVDPDKVRAVEECHQRALEAEAKVMEKGSRANRRRLDEATSAERDALHALGLSSYDQFLKYLAPTLDADARAERLAEARAAVGDAETVWAELHGGSVPDTWTDLHLERVALVEEAHALLGRDVAPDALDEALRNHLETVVDTTWAEDALAKALAATHTALGAGGIEAAAERVIAEAPAKQADRDQAETQLQEIDAELRTIEEELAALTPAAVLDGAPSAASSEQRTAGVAGLEDEVAAAEAALTAAEEAVAEAKQRLRRAEESASAEQAAAQRAEDAKAGVVAAREALALAEEAVSAARGAASEAADAAAQAASAAAAATTAARFEARLALVARAAAHRATDQPLVVAEAGSLGEPGEVLSLLREVSGAAQVVVIDARGELGDAAGSLGDDGRLVLL